MTHIRGWIARVRNAHPDHHAIARSLAWVALFVLFASLARAAKEMVIAYRFGISSEVDAYLFVFNLISWPIGVWFSILTVVLIPLAARIKQGASADLPRFRSELLGLTILFGVILTYVSWIGLPWLLHSPWTGLPNTTATIAVKMVPALSWLALLGAVISLFSAWMLAAGRHANTLLESIPALVILAVLLVFPGDRIEPLVWGTLAGFIFHLASLAIPLARQGEIEIPRFTRQSPQWTPFWQGFGIMVGGQILMSLITVIDQFFAAHLGAGAISTLSYANRVLALLLGLGATAISRATLPVFSKAEAQGRKQVRHVAIHWMRLLFIIGLVITAAAWGLAPEGIKLLYVRGAFTNQDSIIVTEAFRYGLAQIPFYFSGLVMVSLLVSQRKYHVILIIGALNLLTKIIFNYLTTPQFGLNGLLISTSLMTAFSSLFLMFSIFNINRDKFNEH
jgi:peptidoglycan biosynthesis protein MviN/MurJ (putative lipid II flippase)